MGFSNELSCDAGSFSSISTGFFSQRFWGFISPHWNPGLHGLSCSPIVPPGLFTCKCKTTRSASHCLVSPLHPGCPSLPLLPVWVNVSSLTPWLSDFHTVQFSGSSGYFLFWNLLLSFFWLCEEATCIYLCLHLGWKFWGMLFIALFFLHYGIHPRVTRCIWLSCFLISFNLENILSF